MGRGTGAKVPFQRSTPLGRGTWNEESTVGCRRVAGPLGRPLPYPVAPSAAMWDRLSDCGARIIFGLIVFSVLATAILLQAPKGLGDLHHSFFLDTAYC